MGERLKDKVAIVTGAGRGIGRAHALALATEGAKVVVNDFGAERNGAGSSAKPANDVVEEIIRLGGQAVANYGSVADFETARGIVQSAIDHFGRLDILVNNAGVFWHFLIHEMPEEAWDRVIAVHLKGSFNMCRHAVPIMMQQRYGRIINTTSSQWRNPEGRANYGAAKGGIVSLTWDLAFELRDCGITANAVAPFADTRRANSPQSTQAEMLKRAGLNRKKPADEQGDERATPEYVCIRSFIGTSMRPREFLMTCSACGESTGNHNCTRGISSVIPAQAGIQVLCHSPYRPWMPAFAGMTVPGVGQRA